jgi:hypothetical protein
LVAKNDKFKKLYDSRPRNVEELAQELNKLMEHKNG